MEFDFFIFGGCFVDWGFGVVDFKERKEEGTGISGYQGKGPGYQEIGNPIN